MKTIKAFEQIHLSKVSVYLLVVSETAEFETNLAKRRSAS